MKRIRKQTGKTIGLQHQPREWIIMTTGYDRGARHLSACSKKQIRFKEDLIKKMKIKNEKKF